MIYDGILRNFWIVLQFEQRINLETSAPSFCFFWYQRLTTNALCNSWILRLSLCLKQTCFGNFILQKISLSFLWVMLWTSDSFLSLARSFQGKQQSRERETVNSQRMKPLRNAAITEVNSSYEANNSNQTRSHFPSPPGSLATRDFLEDSLFCLRSSHIYDDTFQSNEYVITSKFSQHWCLWQSNLREFMEKLVFLKAIETLKTCFTMREFLEHTFKEFDECSLICAFLGGKHPGIGF